jgi:hypothetical protein
MQVLQSKEHFTNIYPRDFFTELPLFLKNLAQIPSRTVFNQQKYVLAVLE